MTKRFGMGAAGIGVGLIAAAAGALGVPGIAWVFAAAIGGLLLLHAAVVGEASPVAARLQVENRPPPEMIGGRHFVSASVSELLRPFRDQNSREAARLSHSYIGCWIKTDGVVPDETVFDNENLGQDVALSTRRQGTPKVFIRFVEQDPMKRRSWTPGDKLSVVGRIASIGPWALVLHDCEST
jgi:hypothetical protein